MKEQLAEMYLTLGQEILSNLIALIDLYDGVECDDKYKLKQAIDVIQKLKKVK